MDHGLAKAGRYALTVSAVGVAIYSLRFALVPADIWLVVDRSIRGVIEHAPVQALTHMIVAPIALIVGPFQFWPGLRARRPALHRWTGRVYVAACLIAGIGALATAPFAAGGPIAGVGFGLLAICWLFTTAGGLYAALTRQFARHRIWMRFSYALTFGAVTLRLQIPLGLMFLGFPSYPPLSQWLAYTSWIPNVIVVALYTWLRAPVPAPPKTAKV